MHLFVTGASGHVASAVIPELLAAGHTVTGLARSDTAAAAVRALGADVRRGDLGDLPGLADAAREADGVVHLAFDHGKQQAGDLAGAVEADLRAIDAMGEALAGTGKLFVGTNATGGIALAGFPGVLTEDDVLPGGPRIDAENRVIALAGRGVRPVVVRLPPAVHSAGRYGFVSGLIEIARATGTSGYPGDGTNRWPAVDTRDAARVYRLAVENASGDGTRLHAVAEEGIALRTIAEAVGRRLNVPAASVPPDRFGLLSAFAVLDNPVSSKRTRDALGWSPTRPGLLDDLG